MIVDDRAKNSALNGPVPPLGVGGHAGSETERLEAELDQLAAQLTYDGKCQVEIRFNGLNYDLIGNCKWMTWWTATSHPRPKPPSASSWARWLNSRRPAMTITSLDFETANYSRVSMCAIPGVAVFEDGNLTECLDWPVRPPKGHGWFRDDFTE